MYGIDEPSEKSRFDHVWGSVHFGSSVMQDIIFCDEVVYIERQIDNFIKRYRVQMGSSVPIGHNIFDYGAWYFIDAVLLFKFSNQYHHARMYMEGSVHEMWNAPSFGYFKCKSLFVHRLSKSRSTKSWSTRSFHLSLSEDLMTCH